MKVLVALTIALMTFVTNVWAQDRVVVLVAQPQLKGFYAKTVVVVAADVGGNIGFILNRPATVDGLKQSRLGDLFPLDEPSRKLNAPVWLGGPINPQTVWALARDHKNAKAFVNIGDTGYKMVLSGNAVDKLIAEGAPTTSFYAGFVIWQPGELESEMKDKIWFSTTMTMDEVIALEKDNKTWETLSKQLTVRENSI